VRAAAAGSERLLGGAAVLRRTLRGFVSVPSTSNSASTLPLILGDGLRAGVARAESKRGAQPCWERQDKKHRSHHCGAILNSRSQEMTTPTMASQ
jgi:hypothetical protein